MGTREEEEPVPHRSCRGARAVALPPAASWLQPCWGWARGTTSGHGTPRGPQVGCTAATGAAASPARAHSLQELLKASPSPRTAFAPSRSRATRGLSGAPADRRQSPPWEIPHGAGGGQWCHPALRAARGRSLGDQPCLPCRAEGGRNAPD